MRLVPVTDTPPVTPAVPALPMPESVTVVALSVRLVSAEAPPMMPPTPMVPEDAATESACAPSIVPVKVTLALSEVRVASAPSVTACR